MMLSIVGISALTVIVMWLIPIPKHEKSQNMTKEMLS